MKELIKCLQLDFAAIGAWVGFFVGGCDGFVITLLCFVCLDYITGVAAAVVEKRLSSSVGFIGIARKVFIFMLVGAAHLLDVHILKAPGILRTAVIFYYISNEGISLTENCARVGLPVPKKIIDVLEQIKKDGDDHGKNGEDGKDDKNDRT